MVRRGRARAGVPRVGLGVTRGVVAVVGLWALAGCGLPEGEYFGKVGEPEPAHMRWCNAGEPEYIDPALVTSTVGMPISYSLFDGLTVLDRDGHTQASLATHWDISPDQRRFVFHMHDRGRWSNGRPITAHDVAYQLVRVLHPLSFSRNAEVLWRIKNGQLYTEGRIKLVTRDAGPFRAGEVVEVLGVAGAGSITLPGTGLPELVPPRELLIPDSNLRTADAPLHLRDRGAAADQAYAVVPPGGEVTVVEIDHPTEQDRAGDDRWAYVHWADGDGVYGWVPARELTGQPHGELLYWVRRVPVPHRVGPAGDIELADIPAALEVTQEMGQVRGADLLMVPEALGVRTPDDHTLVIETWGPVPYFIDLTPQRMFRPTPREVVSRYPLRWTRSPELIVTSGAFHLAGWYERDRIELVASETYWARDQVALQRLTAYSINEQAAATNYYMQGSCDAVSSSSVPVSYLPALNGDMRGGRPYADYTAAPYLAIYFYAINTEKLTNVHLRRALNLAIDRRDIPAILHGGQTPSAQYTPGEPIAQLSDAERARCGVTRDTPGVAMLMADGLCYVPPPGLDFDPDAARMELAQARAELGDAFPEPLSLKFNVGYEGHKLIAEYIQDQWRKNLGLQVELSSQEWKTYLKATVAGEYQVARMGWIGSFPDPESEFVSIFKCGSPFNRPRWCNDEFERLFRQVESTADRVQRLALLRRAEEVVIREAAVIPLYVYTQHHLQKPYVRDLTVNFPDQPPLTRAWIDPGWGAAAAGGGEAP